ncbi:M15 family metallopeptidase [Microbacterium sp.]|uniref:M15 family metallopeptidase n=1 Tax=Microbacterium sp. TaxID=51671 RepID=UPI002810ECCA|nr:M15 family metallopeptidase [Microbacterium sp.]
MSATQPRHAVRTPLAVRIATPIGVLVTALASLFTLWGEFEPTPVPPAPAAAMALPSVARDAETARNPCGDAEVKAALAAGDDAATIAAFGGGEQFRAAIAAGNAPCIALDDPQRVWVVVNKLRPLEPADYAPTSLGRIGLQATSRSTGLRAEAVAALDRMAADARSAGAGVLGVNNGYRSFGVQQTTYASHVRARGQEGADAGSARPGHSEHQTGLAVDVIACSPACGGLDEFGDTPQGRWVAENAWRYGFIVRYEQGETGTTGYLAEPWHLRYIGPELAAAYQQGGYRTLEAFFGLPAAPDYGH